MFDAPWKALSLALSIALAACAQMPARPGADLDGAPRAALNAFLDAERAGDFGKAYVLLSSDLRARYTPERLRSDFERDRALAEDKLARIRAAVGAGESMKVEAHRAELPVGGGHSVKLLEEADGWRIESLE